MTKALGIKDRTYIYKMIRDYNNEGWNETTGLSYT
jgi:hypothetical protein